MYGHMMGTSELSEDVEPHDVLLHHLLCQEQLGLLCVVKPVPAYHPPFMRAPQILSLLLQCTMQCMISKSFACLTTALPHFCSVSSGVHTFEYLDYLHHSVCCALHHLDPYVGQCEIQVAEDAGHAQHGRGGSGIALLQQLDNLRSAATDQDQGLVQLFISKRVA